MYHISFESRSENCWLYFQGTRSNDLRNLQKATKDMVENMPNVADILSFGSLGVSLSPEALKLMNGTFEKRMRIFTNGTLQKQMSRIGKTLMDMHKRDWSKVSKNGRDKGPRDSKRSRKLSAAAPSPTTRPAESAPSRDAQADLDPPSVSGTQPGPAPSNHANADTSSECNAQDDPAPANNAAADPAPHAQVSPSLRNNA